jgi:hypothetical protein
MPSPGLGQHYNPFDADVGNSPLILDECNVLQCQGDMQLKRNTTCEKRDYVCCYFGVVLVPWKKCNNIGFEPKLIITSHDLQRTRDYSNLGYVAHFI